MIKLDDFEIRVLSKSRQESEGSIAEYPVVVTSVDSSTDGYMKLDTTDQEFLANLVRVRSVESNLELRRKFGEILFNALFNNRIRDQWVACSQKAEGLRIRLNIKAPELAILPWELLYDQYFDFLGTAANIGLSRYLERQLEYPLQRIEDKIRVLLIAQSPCGLPEIRTDEFVQLKDAIKNIGSSVELSVLENRPISDIEQTLQKQNYHVVHFLGHGIGGSLALTDINGQLHSIASEEFAQLLQGRHSVRLVVLNACFSSQGDESGLFSGVGPALIKKRIPAVIAMQYPAVNLSTAAQFSRKFYAALANGVPIDLAVNQSRNSLAVGELLNGREWSTPILYVGTRRGDMLFWSLDKRSWSVRQPESKSVEIPSTPTEYVEIIKDIQKRVKGLQEWLELDETYQRLRVTVNSFAEQVKLFQQSSKQSDVTRQQIAIDQLDRLWQLCVHIINELEWMPSRFNFITSSAEPLPDKRNFVSWISELTQLGIHIQEKIDAHDLTAVDGATSIFLRRLEQRSRGPLNVVREEVKYINDLTIQVEAKIFTS